MKKLKQQSNVLLLRMLFLLAMVLTGSSSSWGQTSLGKMEFTSYPTNGSNGSFWLFDNGTFSAGCNGLTDETATKSDKFLIKLGSEGYFELNFNEGVIKAGDILKVECGCIYGDGTPALGFIVNGHTTSATPSSNSEVLALQYTIQASDFMDGTDGKKKIQIKRNGYSTGYHSIEVIQTQKFTVNFGSNNPSWGTVTATANGKSLTSGEQVGNNTEVTFTATPTGTNLPWKWIIDGTDKYSQDPQTITVTKDITVNHEFGSVYVNVYTNNANYGTVNIKHGDQNATTFHVTPWAGEFTLTATATANGKFMGWYKDADHTQKIDGAEATYTVTNPSGTNNYFAYFVEGANTITKPGCGGYYMDQSKLNAGTATLNVSGGKGTVTTGASGGYISVKFDQAYSFTNLKKYTVSGTNVAANLNNVQFLKNGVGIENANFYSGCSDKDLTYQNKNSVLTSVDEIRFHFKENTTTTIDYIYFEVDHGPRTKPTLANPTAAEMKIFSDETLQLRITNTAGFWREYTNDQYNTETFAHIGHDANDAAEYKPSYDISGLTVGDYYFGIKDGGNCAENNKYHESGLVTVHVKVIEPIKSVDVNGTTRHYDVYAPQGISGKVGVVVSLHGASNDYDNGRVDFNGIADANKGDANKQFVVIYPRGLMRQLRGTERGWDSYTEDGTEDVDFFKAAVKDIDGKNGLTVDYNRIYLAGFSNGGMMAYKAAHQAGDFFKAFASVGGYPVNESHLYHAGVQPTPFIHIQGKADGIFPDATYPLNVVAHNMMFRNGADFTPAGDGNGVITPHHQNVEEDCHNAGNGGAAYYMYKVANMGHTWTWDWTGDGKDDIAETLWKFFNKSNLTNNLDKTLKFRIYDTANFWNVVNNGETGGVQVGYIGFEKPNGKTVLTYGGLTNKSTSSTEYNKDTNNKNLWHSLQFKGVVGGTPHYLKLNITTTGATATDYFIIKLVKTGESTPVVIRRYQANAGNGVAGNDDYFVNFNALNGWNEYKLVVERSREDLDVKVNGVEFHSGSAKENAAFFPTDLNTVLSDMNPIYQPVYGQTYNAVAKEYLPIATIPVPTEETPVAERTIEDVLKYTKDGNTTTLTSIPSSTTTDAGKLFINIAKSGKETTEQAEFKSKNAYVLGTGYSMNATNGIALSHNGPAGMPAYVAGSGDFPTKGVIAMKVQGTFDLTFLLLNALGDTPRKLKVYYTNDQLNGELKEWKNWDFTGTRNETNANGKNVLDLPVRMAQLGQDGTSTIFLTYEGEESDDNVWVKGIIAHRPNLDVTIGRTDKLRYKNGSPINSKNDKLTCFGENKPYQWNFGTSNFSAIDPKTGEEAKKINKFDGRTYIGGLGPNGEELKDHLLVFSDGASEDNKASFDGRPSNGRHAGYEDDLTDNNEHIEFNHPTTYSGTHASGAEQNGFDKDRRSFTPILSNGLKVNVTGSGWFTIACAAPNGPVKMKVLSSTNGGNAYINVLREFDVPQASSDVDWKEYKVYLKAHQEKNGSAGFWDGNVLDGQIDPEDTQMSLYVVFEKDPNFTGKYMDGSVEADAQLNIHYLQWLNELPMDYVFQREENPALLTEPQAILRYNAHGRQDYDKDRTLTEANDKEKVVLRWQAGNKSIKETLDGIAKETFNSNDQKTTAAGQQSVWGSASRIGDNDNRYYWDIAANPAVASHTEAAQRFTEGYKYEDATKYDLSKKNSEMEFGLPISGSFYRLYPEKNGHVIAYVIPTVAGQTVYVLDETGAPIGQLSNENAAYTDWTQTEKAHGVVKTVAGASRTDDAYSPSTLSTIRLDILVSAGKEYFICGSEPISLAALHWYQTREGDATAATLENEGENTDVINDANSGAVYRDVALSRTFTAGKWASLVLPFSMNELKFKEVFGDNAICIHFTSVDENNTVNLTHHYYNMIVAGRPVFVRPSADGSIFTNGNIKDVTLQAGDVIPTNADGIVFTGNIGKTTMPANSLFMSGNAIKHTTEAKEVKAMRAWIQGGDVLKDINKPSSPAPVARLLNYDGTLLDGDIATGIETALAEAGMDAAVIGASTVIYNLQGNKVATGAEMLNLPAGVYVVKGKKFIVK